MTVNLGTPPGVSQQEYGDVRDVRRVFGFTETFTYNLWYKGKIHGVLIPGRGRKRGKRIFSFASIRAHIAACESQTPSP